MIATFAAQWNEGATPSSLARPEGFDRTSPTIVIEGVEELVAVLLAA
jgi:hypothetical protein